MKKESWIYSKEAAALEQKLDHAISPIKKVKLKLQKIHSRPVDVIAKITGLFLDKIEKLRD